MFIPHPNLSHLCSSSLSQTFQILSIKGFLPLQILLHTVWSDGCRAPPPIQYTTNDCASVNDMHLLTLVLRRRCLATQWKEKQDPGDAPVPSRPSHLRCGAPEAATSLLSHSRTSKPQEKMGNMATEIVAFLLTISGWILVSSTLPTDYWKVSSVDGTVITTATFWSNLWKTCVTDSTGVSNCKDFPSMLALDGEFGLSEVIETEI